MPWYQVNRKIPVKRYIPFRRPDGGCHAGELQDREQAPSLPPPNQGGAGIPGGAAPGWLMRSHHEASYPG